MRAMTTRLTTITSVLLLLNLAAAALAAPTVLPRSFLRGFDPVTVLFEEQRGPAAGGPEDNPAKFLTITPAPAGEYRWVDARTLIFKPAVAWAPLTRFTVTAAGQSHPLHTLMVAPTALNPADGVSDLDPVEEVTLTFADPIAVADLARMVTFELRALPGVDQGPPRRLTSADFRIKALERASATSAAGYVFQLAHPIPHGTAVVVRIQLALDDSSRDGLATYTFSTKEAFRVTAIGCSSDGSGEPEPEPSAEAVPDPEPSPDDAEPATPENAETAASGDDGDENTAPAEEHPAPRRAKKVAHHHRRRHHRLESGWLPLTIGGIHYTREQAVNGGTGAPAVGLRFSANPGTLSLSDVKALVHFSPAVPDLAFTVNGSDVTITGKFDRDAMYQAELTPAPVKDEHGRPLQMEGASGFFFYFPGQPAFLHWNQAQGIVERYGPQVFPMAARKDGRVDLRIYKVDPLDRSFWPWAPRSVPVDESTRPPGPGEEPPSADSLIEALSPDDLKVRLMMLGSPPISVITGLPVRRDGGSTGFGLPLKEHLASISGADEPGTYLVGVRRLNGDSTRNYVRLQVTDLCLSTV